MSYRLLRICTLLPLTSIAHWHMSLKVRASTSTHYIFSESLPACYLIELLHFYASLIQNHLVSPTLVQTIQQCVQDVWFPVLRRISATDNADVVRTKTAFWREYARCIGLDPDILEEKGQRKLELGSNRTRCWWKGCLCAVRKPGHKMRVCTGCGRARYCHVRCQTL